MLNSFLQAAGGAEWSRGRGGVVRAVSDLGPPEQSWAGGQEQAGVGVWGDDGVVRYVHGATGRGRCTGMPTGLFWHRTQWREFNPTASVHNAIKDFVQGLFYAERSILLIKLLKHIAKLQKQVVSAVIIQHDAAISI